MEPSDDDLTSLIRRSGARDPAVRARLMRRAYGELRLMARTRRSHRSTGEPPPETTLILHEAFLKVFPRGERTEVRFDGRAHFFGIFARAMDQFLIDWFRAQRRKKRGGGRGAGPLRADGSGVPSSDGPEDAGDDVMEMRWMVLTALAELGIHAPLAADVVWLRYGHDLSLEETARELEIAPRTVSKYWNFARAWLRRRLDEGESDPDGPASPCPTDPAPPSPSQTHAADRPPPDP
jgi:RNA polymerase sigma factor (TIGR02999 family)